MSAIIAGEACKDCGEKYYTSLGHPTWFKKATKKVPEQLTPDEAKLKKIFVNIQKSGRCMKCQLISCIEQAAFISEVLSIDLDVEDDASGT